MCHEFGDSRGVSPHGDLLAYAVCAIDEECRATPAPTKGDLANTVHVVLRVVLAEFYRSNGDLGDRHCQAGVVCSPLALVSNCVLWTRDYVAELGRLFVEQSSCCVGTLEILEVEQVEERLSIPNQTDHLPSRALEHHEQFHTGSIAPTRTQSELDLALCRPTGAGALVATRALLLDGCRHAAGVVVAARQESPRVDERSLPRCDAHSFAWSPRIDNTGSHAAGGGEPCGGGGGVRVSSAIVFPRTRRWQCVDAETSTFVA